MTSLQQPGETNFNAVSHNSGSMRNFNAVSHNSGGMRQTGAVLNSASDRLLGKWSVLIG